MLTKYPWSAGPGQHSFRQFTNNTNECIGNTLHIFVLSWIVHFVFNLWGKNQIICTLFNLIYMQVSLTENIAMSKCCMDTNSVAKCACRLAIINLDYLQARGIIFEFRWVNSLVTDWMFSQTSTVRFGPNDRTCFCRTHNFFSLLCNAFFKMATLDISSLANTSSCKQFYH